MNTKIIALGLVIVLMLGADMASALTKEENFFKKFNSSDDVGACERW